MKQMEQGNDMSAEVEFYRNEDGYGKCPKCGFDGVNAGVIYNHKAHTADCETKCLRCDYGMGQTLPFFGKESLKKIHASLEEQKGFWNKASDNQQDRAYGYFRAADVMRKNANETLQAAARLEKQGNEIIRRFNLNRDNKEDEHGTE
ncbi:MAG: hypothetical protein CVV04_11960 [Firmicutes bacterium HGW-Firmicutes-9]|nr:MAG: hypothetical protein CVV04_11960 [Firmicutes bacterium HGW-Firmicutes-9]